MTSRILLADDSITIQKVVNLTFADEGIEVIAVSNGEVAERRLSEINPDLVLADIFMPGKNGYELCEFVKQSPQFSNVPVVLLVGAFEPFNEAEARRVRADAHLTKPFESRTLVETVRKLIGKSGRAGAAASQSGPLQGTAPAEAQPVAQPAFNLDLAAMTPEWSAAAQAPSVDGNPFGAVPNTAPLTDPSPLDLDYGSFGRGDNVPSGFPMQPEQSGSDTGFSFVSSVKDTAELPQIDGIEDPGPVESSWKPEPIEFHGQSSVPQSAPPTEASDDTFGAPFEVSNEAAGFKVHSTFSGQPPSIDLDFDKLEAPAPSAPENVVSFDVDFGAFSAADAPAASAEPDHVPADPPNEVARSEESAWASTNTDYSFSPHSEPEPEVTERPQAEAAPFALDDPLGDVLSVDTAQPEAGGFDFVPQEPADVEEKVPAAVRNPWDSALHQANSPLEPDASGAMTFQDGSASDKAAVVHSGLSFEAFSPVTDEPAEAEPVEAAEIVEATPPKTADSEEAFTSSEMWSSEVPQFAAIDIEAVTVEEAQVPAADYGDPLDAGTGFAFASVGDPLGDELPEPPAPPPPPIVEIAPDLAHKAESPVDLPQGVIDEIVRRVIAQIGDAVVREIAWEVVPDCVERVVEKLTHEGASKRM